MDWSCAVCPRGGACVGSVVWDQVIPLFGWWKIPKTERHSEAIFAECLFSPACLGSPNPALVAKHLEAGFPLTKQKEHNRNNNTWCSEGLGFRNQSRLCHTCAIGFRRQGLNECSLCPTNAGQNWGLMVLGVFIIFVVIVIIVSGTINEAGKSPLSSSIKKILLNYLQVITLCSGFPLRWPSGTCL